MPSFRPHPSGSVSMVCSLGSFKSPTDGSSSSKTTDLLSQCAQYLLALAAHTSVFSSHSNTNTENKVVEQHGIDILSTSADREQ